MFQTLKSNSPFSAPRDDTARATCGNGAKRKLLSFVTKGSGDIFLAAFDPAGALQWVQLAGGVRNDSVYPLVFRAPDELVCAGAFSALATFGTREVKESGASDLYGAKWKLPPAP